MFSEACATLTGVAENPHAYAEDWKRKHDRKVIGIMPMNFPPDIVHAAGALPVVVQDTREPITEGASLLPEFYCGYTRSLVDQAAKGSLDVFDGFLCVDHCISLLGAYDGIRFTLPDRPAPLTQFIASMDEPWSYPNITARVADAVRADRGLSRRHAVTREPVAQHPRLQPQPSAPAPGVRPAPFRPVADHRVGHADAGQVQHGHGPEEHTALLVDIVEAVEAERDSAPALVPVHSRVTSATRRGPSCSS